ncbi:MAG: hypothetical protein MI685_00035, partial [Chlorobiales bacterium]|nr:hypothetical protein [Chlorobiales bacterium]
MENLKGTDQDPIINYIGKVRKAVDYNHPAEVAYRNGEDRRAGQVAGEVEYEQREYIDDSGSMYVIEDREDGSYVIGRQKEGQDFISYDGGLRID